MNASLDQFRSEYDEESLGMLSDILSTLYQNPERSVLREYIANGIDAHRISGYNGPVEVTLPATSRPTLVITDHGNGLSREDMQRVYFSYVRSTKREDDTQIGALGLGAKSAFALTKSWTVTNVHNGLKYVVASVNDDYGAPQQTVLVNGVPTDEHSGITVTIPISERHLSHRWYDTATSLALWLPKGSVSINGESRLKHWTSGTEVYGNSIRANGVSHSYREFNVFQAIMGGIGYVVDDLTKETVHQEAAALLRDCTYDTADVFGALLKHPKASLAKDTNYGINNVSVEDAEKNLARMGYAHMALRDSLLASSMARPLRVDLGDVDFMPSRESVKGTPRTIAALAQAVAGTVNQLSKDVLSARSKSPEERIALARSLAVSTGVNEREALSAVGIHDTDTTVYSIGVDGRRIGAHSLVLGGHARVLVTGVSGNTLYKGKMYARAHRVTVYVTENPSLVDPYLGDIGRYFVDSSGESTVISHEEFKSSVAIEFPANRGGVDTRHPGWVTDGVGGVIRDMVPFSEIEDHFADVEQVYVADDSPYTQRLHDASSVGMQIAVVNRGRRKYETFVKLLGEDKVSPYSTIGEVVEAKIRSESIRIVATADRDELYAVALSVSERAKRITEELLAVFDSPAGSVVPDGHRARVFAASFVRGAELTDTYRGRALLKAYLRVEKLAVEERDTDAINARIEVDTDPWPLLPNSVSATRRALNHAAMYLAAVG